MNVFQADKLDAAALLEAAETQLAEQRLAPFIRQAWGIIDPTDYMHNWHVDAICEVLEAVTAGQITRLLINLPPRYGKSGYATVCWPVWEWLRNPGMRWVFASYAAELSIKHSVSRRRIIESRWHADRWGGRYQLSTDQNVKSFFENTANGAMYATSIMGSVTGMGGNRVVVDDPHDPRRVESRITREAAISWFDATLYSRLDDKRKAAIVLIMQRLHEGDLSAHVLAQGGYVHLCLPAEAETRQTITFPMSGTVKTREVGDVLWPEREGPKELATAKRSMGSYAYAGQYQQRPAPAGGGLFKRSWMRFWRFDGGKFRLSGGGQSWLVDPDDCQMFAALDVAGGDSEGSDYSVLQIFALSPSFDMLLIHQWRTRDSLPTVTSKAAALCHEHRATLIGVEKNGVGLGVYQSLRGRGLAVRPLHADTNKVTRSRTAQIFMEAGQIHLPDGAAFLADLIDELESFPKSVHDDQVDALSWAAHLAAKLGSTPRLTQSETRMIEHSAERDADDLERSGREAAESAARAGHVGGAIASDAIQAGTADGDVAAWLRGEAVAGIGGSR